MLRLIVLAFVILLIVVSLPGQQPTTVFADLTLALTTQQEPLQQPPPKLEGCVSCHDLIEPMHKYGTTETLDKLKDGKDAVGLTLHCLPWW